MFKQSDLETKVKKAEAVIVKVGNTAKPKNANSNFNGKNIKIDNMTFNGDSDVNWGDFIKINNGGDTEDIDTTGDIPNRIKKEKEVETPEVEPDL